MYLVYYKCWFFLSLFFCLFFLSFFGVYFVTIISIFSMNFIKYINFSLQRVGKYDNISSYFFLNKYFIVICVFFFKSMETFQSVSIYTNSFTLHGNYIISVVSNCFSFHKCYLISKAFLCFKYSALPLLFIKFDAHGILMLISLLHMHFYVVIAPVFAHLFSHCASVQFI